MLYSNTVQYINCATCTVKQQSVKLLHNTVLGIDMSRGHMLSTIEDTDEGPRIHARVTRLMKLVHVVCSMYKSLYLYASTLKHAVPVSAKQFNLLSYYNSYMPTI
jgi:hypothetical protein